MKEEENVVSTNIASPQNREESLNTLYKAGAIAENYEALTGEATSIREEIDLEKSNAENLEM